MKVKESLMLDSASVLLLMEPSKERTHIQRLLISTGCRVQIAANLEEAEVVISSPMNNFDLLVANYDQPYAEGSNGFSVFDNFLARFAQKPGSRWVNGQTKVLLLADKRDKAEMHNLFRHNFMTNLIAKSDVLDKDELIITVGKILRNDIFGIDKYLCYGVAPMAYEIHSSQEKPYLLQAMAQYAESVGVSKRIIQAANNVADELITNSVYNAPIYENGVRPYARRARTVPVDLKPNEYCFLTFACDAKHLVISVRDTFGSLTPDKVRAYLLRCFSMGDDQIEHKQGGAGMGLYFIVESLNKLIINISPGRGTELIGIMDVSGSYKEYAKRSKSFHIFVG